MPATPARRPPSAPRFRMFEQSSRTASDASDRRRRSQHFARLRRDLLEDAGAALVVTLLTITFTAGLGVIALIELPLALALTISYVLDRHRRRSRPRPQRPAARSMLRQWLRIR